MKSFHRIIIYDCFIQEKITFWFLSQPLAVYLVNPSGAGQLALQSLEIAGGYFVISLNHALPYGSS